MRKYIIKVRFNKYELKSQLLIIEAANLVTAFGMVSEHYERQQQRELIDQIDDITSVGEVDAIVYPKST